MQTSASNFRILYILLGMMLLLIPGCTKPPAEESGPTGTPPSTALSREASREAPVETGGSEEVNEVEEAEEIVNLSEAENDVETIDESSSEQSQSGLDYIYQDGLADGWSEWSWDVNVDYQTSNPVHKDQHSMSISPDHAWAGWGLWYEGGIDTTPYAYLNIAIQASKENEWYDLYLLDQGGSTLTEKGYLLNPPVGSWEEIQIPLSQLGGAYSQVFGVRILNTEDVLGTYYLDEIGFGGTAPKPTVTPIPAPQTIQLSVDASLPIHLFSNEMLGIALVNWEHSWDKYFPADVPHLVDVYKAADMGVVRYAGGLWANWVGWERLPQRKPHTEWQPDPANYSPQFVDQVDTSVTYAFHYGINEIDNLAQFAQQTGAEVMMQVNVSKNDPYMWADLLHYTNVENDYNFKYWELGNEFDIETSRDSESGMDADTYQQRVQEYAEILRAVDPDIIIVGGVPSSGHDIIAANWSEGTSEMSRYLIAAVAAGSDSISYHWYQNCNKKSDIEAMTVWAWPLKPGEDGIDDPYQNWRHTYSRIWSQIGPDRVQNEVIPAGSAMTQGISELNFDSCDHNIAPQNSNHLNAIWMSDILGRLAYYGLDYVTWYTGYGTHSQGFPAVFSMEDYYPETVYLRPSYYTLFLYANYFGDQLVSSTSTKEEDISIWASTDSDDPGTLKLIITNISNSIVTSDIDISGFSASSGTKVVLSNPNPLDMTAASNSQSHGTTLNGVTLVAASITAAVDQIEGTPVIIENNRLTETFAPYTATTITLIGDGLSD